MFKSAGLFSLAFIVALVVSNLHSNQPFKPGKLPPADVAALQPGLTLRFYARPGDAVALDARRIRLAALHVPKGAAPTPFVDAGPVHAKLTGYLKNPLKGDYRLRMIGTGTMSLRVNEKEVLKDAGKEIEVELAKNYNRIEVVYSGPAGGDATVRLEWAGEKFGFEPVPPEVLFSRKDDSDLVSHTALREGRQLYADRHCAACHGLPGRIATTDCRMPEMHSAAPQLDDAGNRFRSDWLVAWILNPQELRPEATMPSVLSGPDAEKHAADIAAYVMSFKRGEALKPLAASADAKAGGAIAWKLGCSTCHRPDEPKKPDELARLSHFFTSAKYQANAIAHYLKEPHKRHAWTRMPDFTLSDAEASHLEAHLRDRSKGTIPAKPMGDALRGERLFASVGCANCHQIDASPPKKKRDLAWIDKLDKGCITEKARGNAPDFHLTAAERGVLTAFLKTDGTSFKRESPAEFSMRQVKALRCDSCHRRDGEMTRWHTVLEDEGKVPENLPSLTWVGEKLKPDWTKTLFSGKTDHSARPWIKARMPAFPARAEMLAVGLSHEHGYAINEDVRPPHDAKLAAIGEKLIPQQGGFNCNNCHGIGKTPAIQPFEAPGINLTDAAVRLRYNYYQRWMLAPDRVDVTMRMPVFAVDGKLTQIREPFDGDARKQFDAVWHYIQTLPEKKK
ncbi:MAG: c-type cytochrome [Planctomycetes bacterium]|nr:c-type cytochrome [Planctomycetota bacterium]